MVTSRRTLVWRAETPKSRARFGSQQDQRPQRSQNRDRYTPSEGRRRSSQQRRPPQNRRPLTPEEISRAKAEGYGRHYIQKQIRNKTPMVFEVYGETLEGIILHRLPYNLIIRAGRERRCINKLDVKYCYKQKAGDRFVATVRIDDSVRSQNLGSVMEADERYQVEDRVLLECYRNRYPVTITLRGGEMISGVVDWYSKYEIKLDVKKHSGCLVFRHAIYHLDVHRSV